MYLIAGLGNHGSKYKETRHNFGFMVLDMMTGGQAWESKHDSLIIKTDSVILAKPQLYMNLSGKPIAQILKFYPTAKLVVIHDDLDFPLGSIRIQKNSSAAGHNGVQSIIDELGTQDFIRVRLGINSPSKGEVPGDAFVLQKFSADEEMVVKEVIEKAQTALELIQTEGLEAAQSKFNG